MSWHAVGWFLRNMDRPFASMDDGELNRVSDPKLLHADVHNGELTMVYPGRTNGQQQQQLQQQEQKQRRR